MTIEILILHSEYKVTEKLGKPIPPHMQDGLNTEYRVADVLRKIPFVADISHTEQDTERTDLIVLLEDSTPVTTIRTVDVQVKTSTRGDKDLRRKLSRKGIQPERKKDWRLENNLIVIIGGRKISRNNNKREVTDQEIEESFNRQLSEIIVFQYQQNGIILPLLPESYIQTDERGIA